MMEIFIPVLFVCLNGTCNFLYSKTHYRSEAQCTASVDARKIHMIEMAKQSDQGQFTMLEGTCINTKVDDPKKWA